MKKILIADVIKQSYDEFRDQRNEEILAEMERSDVDEPTAEYLVDNWSSEADRDQVLQAAEDLGVDPQDISDDDVEALNMAGAKGDIESSSGPIIYRYILGLGYMVHLVLNDTNIMYQNIDPQTMSDWINADSAGNYYLKNIRSKVRDDQELCGCNDKPCEDTDVAQINS
jgi:hypothetical protein